MISPFGVDHAGYEPLIIEVSKGYVSAVKGVATTAAKQGKFVATTKKSSRLARQESLGRAHKARETKAGVAYAAESRPMPFHRKSRAAWEKGYNT